MNQALKMIQNSIDKGYFMNTKFLTIRNTAKEYGISEWVLRGMVKRGECPGFYSGTRFYIAVEQLLEKMCGYPVVGRKDNDVA